MKLHRGSCHCGEVVFQVTTELDMAVECNCSMCSRKGIIYHRVDPDRFALLAGADFLSAYQFGTKTAKHWFCKQCGIHTYSNPRVDPSKYSINIRCLDNFAEIKKEVQIKQFDGRHWEQAVEGFKFQKT